MLKPPAAVASVVLCNSQISQFLLLTSFNLILNCSGIWIVLYHFFQFSQKELLYALYKKCRSQILFGIIHNDFIFNIKFQNHNSNQILEFYAFILQWIISNLFTSIKLLALTKLASPLLKRKYCIQKDFCKKEHFVLKKHKNRLCLCARFYAKTTNVKLLSPSLPISFP